MFGPYSFGGGGSGAVLCDAGALVTSCRTPASIDSTGDASGAITADIMVEHDVIA